MQLKTRSFSEPLLTNLESIVQQLSVPSARLSPMFVPSILSVCEYAFNLANNAVIVNSSNKQERQLLQNLHHQLVTNIRHCSEGPANLKFLLPASKYYEGLHNLHYTQQNQLTLTLWKEALSYSQAQPYIKAQVTKKML